MSEITKEQIDSLRQLAENLTNKKFGNIKDPIKLQAIIDLARAEKADEPEAPANPQTTRMAKRNEQYAEHMKLVRVNITPMAPHEKQLQGNFHSAGNSVVGEVTRYVPYNVDWHIEAILLNSLKEKQYRYKREYKDPTTRRTVYENRFGRTFGIVELDSLTEQELRDHERAMKAREYGDH